MLRVFQDATSSGVRMFVGGTNDTPQSEFSKYEVVTGLASTNGDFTTTTSVFNSNGAAAPAFWMEVDYETPVATVAIVGDSIMQGSNGDPGVSSAAYGAAFQALQRLSVSGKSCQLFNAGWSGSPSHGTTVLMQTVISGHLGQFMSYLASGCRPSIAALNPWSGNNTDRFSESQINSVKQTVGVFASICNQYGIKPVLVTPSPRNGITDAEESQRRIFVNYIKTYCSTNSVPLIDRDGVYTDYSLPVGGYKLAEWCLDGIHPTAAGHAVESVEWERVLNDLI